jgi:hypothetical protein
MRKDDAKTAFDELFGRWETSLGIRITAESDPSFSEFCEWVDRNGFSHYFKFRSSTSARDDVERWFIRRFKQSWRY